MTRTIITPQIRQRIIEMALDRMTDREIAAAINVPGLRPIYVAQVVSKARRNGAVIPYRSKLYEARMEERAAQTVALTINIDKGSLDYLRRIGERRCVGADYIAGALIEAIAHDKIADAVLDDGVATTSS